MGRTVFVLGAGSTRGCSFVKSIRGACLPPLDRDFFTQLQRVRAHKHQQVIQGVIQDAVRIFGTNFDATLETMFATVEQIRRMVQATRETRSFRLAELNAIRRRLLLALAALFEEALTVRETDRGRTEMRKCDYMEKFVSQIIRQGDTVLTFNYDCVIDHHLRKFGSGKWNARYGYGFRLGPRGSHLTGEAKWQPEKPAKRDETVRLLKLHGSLHFWIEDPEEEEYRVTLKERPYVYQGRGMRFTIIPPEYMKRFEAGAFRDLWNHAFKAVAKADNLVFVGYSLPMTDAHATALFRTGVRENGLKALVVANPHREVRRRIRSVVQRGLTQSTRVLSVESLEEFVSVPREVWDRG